MNFLIKYNTDSIIMVELRSYRQQNKSKNLKSCIKNRFRSFKEHKHFKNQSKEAEHRIKTINPEFRTLVTYRAFSSKMIYVDYCGISLLTTWHVVKQILNIELKDNINLWSAQRMIKTIYIRDVIDITWCMTQYSK